ncbi:MAG: alpha/beta hydrolase [Mesorhizobium sp.]
MTDLDQANANTPDLSTELDAVLSTLKDYSLDQFLHAGGGVMPLSDWPGGIAVIDCEVKRGRLQPVSHPDLDRTVLDRLQEAASLPGGGVSLLADGYTLLTALMDDPRMVRLVLLSDDTLLDCLTLAGGGRNFFPAELRLAKQILCGMNLNAAAALDGVGHETKRSQFKSLSQKLDVRSQPELAARMMMQIMLQVSEAVALRTAGNEAAFAGLVRRFIPSARTMQIAAPNGDMHRFVDLGPVRGEPLVMLHSQVLPDLSDADIRFLHDHGLRVIIPLRNGAMAPDDRPLRIARHLDHACEGVELARQTFCGDTVHLMTCISGTAYGIEYARRNPEKVVSFALVGASFRPTSGMDTAGRLRYGMLSLALRNWSLYSRAIAFYGRRLRRPGALEQLLFNVYRPSPPDLEVIRAEHDKPHHGERMRRFFTASVESIKHDFYHQAHPRWDAFPRGAFAAAFLHGDRDMIHDLDDVRELAASWGVPVTPIEGAGQLLYHRHFQPLMRAYLAFRPGITDR